MNHIDTVKLVTVISQIWPSMKLDTHTPDAWSLIFDDVPLDAALAAVRVLSKTRTGYITPADIRRQVAADAGLIPATTEAEGLVAASDVAGRRGEGASKLDPVTYAAYRAMGGPTAFTGDTPMSVIRPQWARVWADAARAHTDRVLGGNLSIQVAEHRALTGAPAAPQPAVEPAPATRDRSAATTALIAQMSARLPKTGPEVLHQRETRWKRMQRALTRKPEPNPHFRGFQRPDSEAS